MAQPLAGPAGALVFDGAKTFVQVSSNASLTLNNRATFEAWVNPAASGTILSRGDGGNGSLTDYIVQLATISGALKVGFFTTNGWDYSTGTVPSNVWTHVAVTYDGTNKQFFINGVLDSTVLRPGGFFSSGSPVYLGRQGSACNCNYFKGTMDEVRIWKTNRTAAQISQNFNRTLTGTEAGLAAYYKFDYITGIATRDSSTNGNTGILMNRPLPVPSLAPFPLYLVLNNPNPFTNDCNVPFADPGATVTAAPFSIGGFVGFDAAIKPDGNLEVWRSPDIIINNPPFVTNLIAVAISDINSLGLRANGTVVPWGDTSYGETNVPASATNVVAVSVGDGFDFALRADGTVVGWGDNTYGEINIPASATNVVAIAAGVNNALALRADGTVIGWGQNSASLLNIPPSATNVVAIANDLNGFAGIALKADGSVLAWGSDGYGETNVPASATNVVAIAEDSHSLLALKADGTAVAWGAVYGGQTNIPANATNVVAISVRAFDSLFLKADGTLLTSTLSSPIPTNIDALSVPVSATGTVNPAVFGNYPITYNATNASGTVGATNRIVVVADVKPPNVTLLGANPMILDFGQVFVDPGATAFDQCAGDETSSIVAAGTVNTNVPGLYQRTYTVPDPNGNSRTMVRSVIVQPPQTIILSGKNPAMLECHPGTYAAGAAVLGSPLQIAAGGGDSFAISPTRKIRGWGDVSTTQLAVPSSVTNVMALSVGDLHVLALRADGNIVAWGDNSFGETNVPASATNVIAISAGDSFSLAAKADGTVVGWGDDTYGEINIPTSANNVIALAAGYAHSVALRADGTVVAWGDDSVGEIDVPANANHIIAISAEAGGTHTLALKADGTVVAWGYDGNGQTDIPATATNIVAIAAGGSHSLALRADGTVVAWGYNGQGETNVPASATNVVAIAAGATHSVALRADGAVIAWGDSSACQTCVPGLLSFDILPLPVTSNTTVNVDAVGTYFMIYTATNTSGNSLTNTRTVIVSDSLPPVITLLGANPIQLIAGSSFVDPGATASDQCAGDLTGSIVVGGSVNNFVPGTYTLTYNVTDPSGNTADASRTVQVVAAPSLSAFAASLVATNPDTAIVTAQLSANVNPNGLPTSAFIQYGLNTGYSVSAAPTNFDGVYATSNMTVLTANLSRGIVYHWRAVGSNTVGVTYGPDQLLTVPGLYAAGDLNGDGIVSAGELNGVLSNYFATSPWLYLTNVAGLGQSNVTFALTNSLEGAFTVQISSNLIDWQNLGSAIPRYQFTDTNAPTAPTRYYRLRWP